MCERKRECVREPSPKAAHKPVCERVRVCEKPVCERVRVCENECVCEREKESVCMRAKTEGGEEACE